MKRNTRQIGITISLALVLACALTGSLGKARWSARLPRHRLFRGRWGVAHITGSFGWAFRYEQWAGYVGKDSGQPIRLHSCGIHVRPWRKHNGCNQDQLQLPTHRKGQL